MGNKAQSVVTDNSNAIEILVKKLVGLQSVITIGLYFRDRRVKHHLEFSVFMNSLLEGKCCFSISLSSHTM